ncbi:MAG: bacterio-opsin activator domain-containing protein [Natronomonas sp.]
MSEFDIDASTAKLLEALPDLVYILGLDGRLLWWNDRAREVTGYDDEELSEMDVFDLLPSAQRADAREALNDFESLPPGYTMQFDVLTTDGRRIPHEFNSTALEVSDETVLVSIARDVSLRRDREAALRRQRDELDTMNRISETVHGVIQGIVDAATRAEIESTVCERLAASELYRAVWVGRNTPEEMITPETGVGVDDDFLEAMEALNEHKWTRPSQKALDTGEPQAAQHILESSFPDPVVEVARQRGINSGVSVPLVHRGNVLGVLTVYSSRSEAFNDREQAAFRRLGEIVGFAINAVQTERLLLSDSATRLTFRIEGPEAFLASVSTLADGSCRHEWSTPAGADRYRHYITVSGLPPERVEAIAEETPTVESAEYVGSNGDDGIFEVVTTDSLIRRLLGAGASPVSLEARDGVTTFVVEVPGDADARPIVESAEEFYDAELVSKHEVERPVRTVEAFHDGVDDRLTDKQRAALRHTFFGGYFSWPRNATAEDIAETMDISSPTFHYHLRHAQQALVEAYLQHLED